MIYDLFTVCVKNPTIICFQSSRLPWFPHRKQSLSCYIHGKMIYAEFCETNVDFPFIVRKSYIPYHRQYPRFLIEIHWLLFLIVRIIFFKLAKNDLCDETILLWYHQNESNIGIGFYFYFCFSSFSWRRFLHNAEYCIWINGWKNNRNDFDLILIIGFIWET